MLANFKSSKEEYYLMKQKFFTIWAAALFLMITFFTLPVGSFSIPLEVTHTLQYTVRVYWQGRFYPDSTRIRLEISDIPIPTEYQTVTANLQDGRLENVNGKPVWVIEKYMREVPYTVITFTGTFVVSVDLRNVPEIPHIPVEPIVGMQEYLQPDDRVTLSPQVVSLAREIVTGTENDLPSIITSFVEWIQRNITYSPQLGGDVKLKDYEIIQMKAGVCDEFATLFIAFCRSVGIPARHVQGYSVENENLNRKLETGHAWAEVWIPERGWLPVDPTWVDLGSAKKFVTGGEGVHYRYWGAPPGSGITKVEYAVTPIGWQFLYELENSVILSGEQTENGWRVSIANVSSVPLLDNLIVKRYVEEYERYEDVQGWPKLIFLNPGENLSFEVGQFDYGWAYSRLGGSINLWKPQEIPFLPTEQMFWIALAVLIVLLSVTVAMVVRRR